MPLFQVQEVPGYERLISEPFELGHPDKEISFGFVSQASRFKFLRLDSGEIMAFFGIYMSQTPLKLISDDLAFLNSCFQKVQITYTLGEETTVTERHRAMASIYDMRLERVIIWYVYLSAKLKTIVQFSRLMRSRSAGNRGSHACPV